ncbi:hypothetical protein HK098_000571 [Nowakowskiella sp. JEL0407]|nr:hypothetical protein HK098_000571 [Nowakowskiella sp. JEL0407]
MGELEDATDRYMDAIMEAVELTNGNTRLPYIASLIEQVLLKGTLEYLAVAGSNPSYANTIYDEKIPVEYCVLSALVYPLDLDGFYGEGHHKIFKHFLTLCGNTKDKRKVWEAIMPLPIYAPEFRFVSELVWGLLCNYFHVLRDESATAGIGKIWYDPEGEIPVSEKFLEGVAKKQVERNLILWTWVGKQLKVVLDVRRSVRKWM